jgi:hypothetical protein
MCPKATTRPRSPQDSFRQRACVYEWGEYMTYEMEVLSSANVDTDHGSYIYC